MRGILHIGAEKTGTTTLQEFFYANRKLLAKDGVTYPRFAGSKQHSLLATYAMDPLRDNLQTRLSSRLRAAERGAWASDFRSSIFRELMTPRPGMDTLLVSSELLHSQLQSTGEIRRLKGLLDLWCDKYRVVFYMRRQDQMAVSLYSTYLRTGGTRKHILEPRASPIHYFDYIGILEKWESVFGSNAISPKIFDASGFVEGDLITDFASTCGFGNVSTYVRPARKNTALSWQAQSLLRAVNCELGRMRTGQEQDQGDIRPMRRNLVEVLERNSIGPQAKPLKSDALRFYEPYRRGNAMVAERWFGRSELFEECSLDDYPERVEDIPRLDADFVRRITEEYAALVCVEGKATTANGVSHVDPILRTLQRLSSSV